MRQTATRKHVPGWWAFLAAMGASWRWDFFIEPLHPMVPDAAQPATLIGGGKSTDYPTLQEAIMAWHRLPPEQARQAMIKGMGDRIYTALEILRFHYKPKLM